MKKQLIALALVCTSFNGHSEEWSTWMASTTRNAAMYLNCSVILNMWGHPKDAEKFYKKSVDSYRKVGLLAKKTDLYNTRVELTKFLRNNPKYIRTAASRCFDGTRYR